MRIAFPWLGATLIAAASLPAAACGDDDTGATPDAGDALGVPDGAAPPDTTPTGTSIGAAGGTASSSDGKLVLVLPPGALTTDARIGIAPVIGAAVGPELTALGAVDVFELTPDGLTFAEPVVATLALAPIAAAPGALEGAFSAFAVQSATGVIEAIEDPTLTLDGATGAASLGGTLRHFSKLTRLRKPLVQAGNPDMDLVTVAITYPSELDVDEAGPIQISARPPGSVLRFDPAAFMLFRLGSESANVDVVGIEPGALTPVSHVANEALAFATSVRCKARGDAEQVRFVVAIEAQESVLQLNDGTLPQPMIITKRLRADVTLPIKCVGKQEAPVAVADAYAGKPGEAINIAAPGVLANDTDADGDAMHAELLDGPSEGALLLLDNGGFTFEPGAFVGTTTFTYRACDATACGESATVTLRVEPTTPTHFVGLMRHFKLAYTDCDNAGPGGDVLFLPNGSLGAVEVDPKYLCVNTAGTQFRAYSTFYTAGPDGIVIDDCYGANGATSDHIEMQWNAAAGRYEGTAKAPNDSLSERQACGDAIEPFDFAGICITPACTQVSYPTADSSISDRLSCAYCSQAVSPECSKPRPWSWEAGLVPTCY